MSPKLCAHDSLLPAPLSSHVILLLSLATYADNIFFFSLSLLYSRERETSRLTRACIYIIRSLARLGAHEPWKFSSRRSRTRVSSGKIRTRLHCLSPHSLSISFRSSRGRLGKWKNKERGGRAFCVDEKKKRRESEKSRCGAASYTESNANARSLAGDFKGSRI